MDRIKGLFIKAWHDPVGSKVIASVIIAAIAAVALWAKSGFSSSLPAVWASTLSIWTWLTAPTSIPVGVELLTLLTFAALYWSLITQRRRAIKEIADDSAKRILDATDANAREIQKVADKLRESERATEISESELATYKQQLLEPLSSMGSEDNQHRDTSAAFGTPQAGSQAVCKQNRARLPGPSSRCARGERVDDSNEQPVIGDRQQESADVLAIVAHSFAAVAFRHFALIRRNSLSRMAAIDPFQPIASVSFEEGRFSSPAYLRSCLLSDYEPRDVNIRYSATYQYSKAAEIFWLPNSAVRDPPFLNWPGLLFKTLSGAPDRLRSIMKSSLLRPGTCNSVAHWRHHE